MKNGSTGDDAKLVQTRLKELGYYTGKVDGKFGASSVKALEVFQKNNGLKVDGAAGSGTYAVLFSVTALRAGVTPTPQAIATPTPGPTATMAPITKDNVVTIKQGVTGQAVTYLQNRLTVLGYYQANADGTCKADDVAAIKAFQKKNGLTADGVAGYETQTRVYSSSAIK